VQWYAGGVWIFLDCFRFICLGLVVGEELLLW